ncbi:hybrid sensor histidine kinase/response regulator [Rhodocista pekingensis]|uniref:histidine kinase n=1 Tax=Rhodocista pekingensis TaxID=201185 RepID=A0ABW2KU69_9PROT
MSDLQERLQQAFRQESREYLEGIRSLLDAAEAGEPPTPAALEEVCRLAHSLKGAARAVDLPEVEGQAHRLETVFDRVRAGQEALDGTAIAGVRALLDAVEDQVAGLGSGPGGGPASARAVPPVDPADPRPDGGDGVAADSVAVRAAAESAPPPRPGAELMRIEAARLDRLLQAGSELVSEQHRQARLGGLLGEVDGQLDRVQTGWLRLRQALRVALPGGLETGGLAALVEAFEGDLRQAARLAGSARGLEMQARRSALQLGEDFQEELRRARLVPVDSVFGTARGMVRDLAAQQGLAVEVRVAGLEAMADRLVLQRLRDPVLQLLRNAVSHGLEPAEERLARGKPAMGTVQLSFAVGEGQLVISVADDGRGIDVGRVRDTGQRLRLLGEGAEAVPEEEVLELLFTPGFTTRETVTTLSGRGMGLSIVRQAALRLGGHAWAGNRPGGGAEFRLVVPVAAMAQELMMVRAGGHVFGLPADCIDGLRRVRRGDLGTAGGQPVVRSDGEVLPLGGLLARAGLGPPELRPAQATVPVLVLKRQGQRLALACDEFIGLRQGLVKDLGAPLPPGGTVSGGVVLEDGSVALVLNPFGLFGTARRRMALTVIDRPAEKRTPVILVVDDSLTTRTLQKSILEAYGYEVRVAVDGAQALKRLRSDPVDLVVTDIQMPQLDGFGLLGAIRDDPALGRTPVILVTSLEKREDRARGLALGADAYIVKREFSQEELLETIRQLL